MSDSYRQMKNLPGNGKHRHRQSRRWLHWLMAGALSVSSLSSAGVAAAEFQVEEATIDDIQQAIQNGETTCEGVVRAYIARAQAYNGACTALVTENGESIAPATGYIRGGAPITFPQNTVAASTYLPDLAEYQGLPLDLGRMESTASDPSVEQQYGMVVGIPGSGQLNALETINIRGERSVTCKGVFDAHPSTGPLPQGAPAECEKFRQYPDALERAAELDAQYGKSPDLNALPMYCAAISVKDWYDVKDMRSTGGNDVAFAMDAAPDDSTVVAELRNKGAIILAVTVAAEVNFNGDEGPNELTSAFVGGGGSIRSSWGGHVCNPYDTERSAGPSSGGAGVSVSANFATCAICETTGGSCREPAGQNAVPSLVTTKGLTSEDGTMTARFINHRPGAICKTIADSARVIDAIRSPQGYFDSKDIFTAIPQGLIPAEPFESFVVTDEALQRNAKPLQGMRIGIVREYMVKHTPNDAAISDRVDEQIKTVLRDQLGAEIVESFDPMYPDDPTVTNMSYTFQDALGEVLAAAAPEYFLQMKGDEPEFAVPGYDVRTNDYLVKLAMGEAPLSPKLNMRRILSGLGETNITAFSAQKYLMERGDTRITDLASYAANSRWRANSQAVGVQNAAHGGGHAIPAPEGVDRVKMQTVFRMAVLKVMRENDLDLFVHPNMSVPQWKIGIDREPTINDRIAAGPSITDLLGVPEITIPAGFNDIVYNPEFVLNDDGKGYTLVTGKVQSMMSNPMPFSINFWAGPGDEPTLLKAASAYEVATKHRVPPQAFGPVK